MTVAEALRLAVERLAAAGVRDAAWDSEVLLRHVLDWDRATLAAEGRAPLAPDAAERFLALIAERATRRPLQQITGVQHFWRQTLRVTPDVLVPRAETELLVEACLGLLPEGADATVVDVGTGSGCIAIALACERPSAEVHAVDLSAAALAVAADNAARAGVSDRIRFHAGDLLAEVAAAGLRADLVVSNPPYVGADEIPGLEPEVRNHEPRTALVPPSGDRYEIYRRLAPQAAALLREGGHLVLEIGQGMHEEVARVCRAAGLELVRLVPDLQGISRVVVARYPGPGVST